MSAARSMKDGDARSVAYFLEECSDPARLSSWDQIKADVIERVPEIDDFLRLKRMAEAMKKVALEKLRELDLTDD